MSPLLPPALLPLATPASWLYRCAIALRNSRYDKPANVLHLDRPVISIGNLTVGGTGKTPTTALIATWLRDALHHPAIAMRGYKSEPGRLSDEQAEYARRIPAVPVVAAPDRHSALLRLFTEQPEIDCVLLDDGFQHRRLHRNLDLVLIDAQSNALNDRLIPAGRLREPPKNLRRASAVIITHAKSLDADLIEAVTHHHGRPPLAWTRHTWSSLRIIDRTGERSEPPTWLARKRMVTLLGIGKPQSVLDQLRALGASQSVSIPARDHQQFTASEFEIITRRCKGYDGLLLTEKDFVKAATFIDSKSFPIPLVIPQLKLEFLAGESDLRSLILSTVNT